MRIDIITVTPRVVQGPIQESIIHRAVERKLIEIHVHHLRDYATDKHQMVDDYPYGGGSGMVLKPEPIFRCVERITDQQHPSEVIYLTPQGEPYRQSLANEFSTREHLVFICGRYKGIDERVRESLVTREISVGDYVLTGGELAALVVIDSVVRLIPGAISDAESALNDSFQDGLLDHPHYTRPEVFRDMAVPRVLLSGNHRTIAAWREDKRIERTEKRRKDLMEESK